MAKLKKAGSNPLRHEGNCGGKKSVALPKGGSNPLKHKGNTSKTK